MKRIWDIIQRISYAIAGFAMFAVVVLIFINVVCRYITHYSIPWCEEMPRYLFVAVIFLTLNIMVSQKAALRVDIIDNFVKGKTKLVVGIVNAVLTSIALGVFTISGLSLMQVGAASISPAMHIPMQVIYALLPLGYFLALIEVIRQEVIEIKEFKTQEGKEAKPL